MLTLSFLRSIVYGLSLVFGGTGVFFLWASFYSSGLGAYAIVCLLTATAITATLPRPAS